MIEEVTKGVEEQDAFKERSLLREKSSQAKVFFALIIAVTALVTLVVFVVFATGRRFQSSEVIPFVAAALTLFLVFSVFLTLVNQEPTILLRIFRHFLLLPGIEISRPRVSVSARQSRLSRQIKRRAERTSRKGEEVVDIDNMIRRSLARLEAEIAEVRRRGGINLAMGMSITILGLGILGYAVYAAPSIQASSTELAAYFLPRLSLVLVTEMFAYFFLRLYKLSMTETKYFQNELTGAEARALSILLASKQEAPALVASVAKSFASLDRNHVLEKGQTTVEIEQARIESDSMRGIAGAMSRSRLWGRAKVDSLSKEGAK